MSSELAVDTFVKNVRTSNVAGEVFFNKFLEHARQYVAKELGEQPPGSLETGIVSEFLVKACDKMGKTPLAAMVYASNAMLYGVSRAEAYISGFTGPIFRLIVESAVKDQVELLGLADESGRLEPYAAANRFIEAITMSLPYFPRDAIRVSKESDGEMHLSISSCPATAVCKALKEEGVKRVIGEECQTASTVASWVKRLSGKTVDCRDLKRDLSGSTCKVEVTLVII
jgi:hypothetical protein